MILFYFNLIITIYFGFIKPYASIFLNTVELFNEMGVTFICYFTLIFTDFVPKVEAQFDGGWFMIYSVIVVLGCNMLIVSLMLGRNA